jgi:hypothetical protein
VVALLMLETSMLSTCGSGIEPSEDR